ncbi:pectate lyase [Filimonas zeae]|nr:pectate lyase [Filimonas zeae]MDR6339487.1 pectate lyase [Filimonas zeae]
MKLTKSLSIAISAISLSAFISSCSKNQVAAEADQLSINTLSATTGNVSALAFTVATANGFAQGTTGGAGGTAVTVTTAANFISQAQSSGAKIITVSGSLNLGSTPVSIASNKTIVGATTASSIIGNVKVDNVTNVIIQNLNISNPTGAGTGDAIEISGSTKVFVNKCNIFDGADGNLDIVRGADNVTVSWCRFYYSAVTTHQFSNLIGNGDNVTTDAGKLHVTLHHNWYDNGVNQRMPRVRFGYVHVYNNYYGSNNDSYNVGVGNNSHILVENNCFENQARLWSDARSSTSVAYQLTWTGNVLINSSYPTWATNYSSPFSRPYSYSPHTGSAIKTTVTLGAGNK